MRFPLALAVALATTLVGCAGDGPPLLPTPTPGGTVTPGAGPWIDQIEQQVFVRNCLFGGCHNVGDAAGQLILEPGLAFANLVGVDSVNSAAAAAGLRRVTSFDPANSFLMIKLLPPSGSFGARMPQARPPLSSEDIELVRNWIVAGAPDKPGPSATRAPTQTPTETAPPTSTASVTPTASETPTPSETPTGTLAPSLTSTPVPTTTATATPRVATFADIKETIFRPSCAVAFCHDSRGETFSGNLNLELARAYDELVGVESAQAAAKAAGLLRVKPGFPDDSFLVRKLCRVELAGPLCPDGLAEGFGSTMPLLGPALTEQQVKDIRAWIARGAPESE